MADKSSRYTSSIIRDIPSEWRYFSHLKPQDKSRLIQIANVNNSPIDSHINTAAIVDFIYKEGLVEEDFSLRSQASAEEINAALASIGLCPLLFYAYKENQLASTFDELLMLIELSVFYLYGKLRESSEDPVSFVDGRHTTKTPVSCADRRFKIRSEYLSYVRLLNTPLRELIPGHALETQPLVLTRDYVEGETGHEILLSKNILTEQQAMQLEFIYKNALKIADKGLYLDIHPGNFCWQEKEEKWYFFDVGPIPRICFSYYDRSGSFVEYINNVWHKRIENIKNDPIRSVNLSLITP